MCEPRPTVHATHEAAKAIGWDSSCVRNEKLFTVILLMLINDDTGASAFASFRNMNMASAREPRPSPLARYTEMRNFGVTPEPAPSADTTIRSAHLGFVVQKHWARRLHYNFRLEMDGVLVSWGVTKGALLRPEGEEGSNPCGGPSAGVRNV